MISAEAAANALPRWVQRLAVATAAGTFLLICAGGLVKSKEAGLSVPDWPLSWGMPEGAVALVLASVTLVLGAAWCFWPTRLLAAGAIFAGLSLAVTYYTYGPKNWYLVDTIRAEHSHRLIAGTVGFMTAILAAALWRYERRSWVRHLGLAALLAVIVQAILGGVTVLKGLPPLVSASHGSLAQAFFGMVLTLAVVTAPDWQRDRAAIVPSDAVVLKRLCVWMVAALFLQVLLGTGVRHSAYVLDSDRQPGLVHDSVAFYWHLGAHLLGLLFVGHTVARVLVRIARRHAEVPEFARPAIALGVLLAVQVLLGIGALFARLKGVMVYDASSAKYDAGAMAFKEVVNTAHVALGALCLGAAIWILLQARRILELAPAAHALPLAASAAEGEAASGMPMRGVAP